MYELTVSVSKEQGQFLQYIQNNIKPVVERIQGVMACDQSKYNNYITVACQDNYGLHLAKTMNGILADILAVGYKKVYLQQNLNLRADNFYTQTLINAMSVFDNNSDKQYIRALIGTNGGQCYLDGYYNFRMSKLKDRWNELVELANDNQQILYDRQLIVDFLDYLIQSIPNTIDTLSVVIDDKHFVLFDTKGNIIKPLALFGADCTPEQYAIINIMCLHPKTLKLYCDIDSLDSDFVYLVKYLFDTKVVENS